MPAAKQRTIELIIGRSLLTAETLASELRDSLVSEIARRRNSLSDAEIIALARRILEDVEPFLVQAMTDAEVAAWIAGTQSVVDRLPALALDVLGGPPQPPGGGITSLLAGGADEPVLSFPLIERAAESLLERNIVTRPEFDRLGREARARAFTVAREESEDAIATIRDALAETIEEGASLGEFRKRLGEDLDGSFIGPAHRETVYRTNIQASFHQAHDELANDPIVAEVFPYQSYEPITDGRVREEHLALKTLGLNGTNVYRRDDIEFWSVFTPPWSFNCFLPGTVVQGRFNLGLKSFYSGQAVEIVTRRGNRLSVTANHPILTMQGFVPAESLCNGDYVLSYCERAERKDAEFISPRVVMRGGLDSRSKQNAPAPIEQIFGSLSDLGRIGSLPLAPEDLHGDAQPWNGYIDVVGAFRELRCNPESPRRNGVHDLSLSVSNMQRPQLAGNRLSSFGDYTSRSVSVGINHSLDQQSRHFGMCRVLQTLHFGMASDLDASLYESAPNGGVAASYVAGQVEQRRTGFVSAHQDCNVADVNSGWVPLESFDLLAASQSHASTLEGAANSRFADVRLAANLCDRFPREVVCDEIVEVRQFQYSGHVYDLQSPNGYMVSESIIVSNCRCGVNLLSVEAAARKGVVEARKWDRTGQPPANPEHRLQDIPFRPEEGFVGGRRLSLFVRLAQVHAPAGGVTVGGKQFKGGEFIPGDVIEKATAEEKAKIEGKGETKADPKQKAAKQTGTPEFKKWFGKSKVVDSKGEPLVVFHGTNAEFNKFEKKFLKNPRELKAFFFAMKESLAGAFGSKRVIKAYIKLENPATFKDIVRVAQTGVKTNKIQNVLKKEGFDGVFDPDRGMVLAFEPKQIKSATGNRGTFDPKNPDIRMSVN